MPLRMQTLANNFVLASSKLQGNLTFCRLKRTFLILPPAHGKNCWFQSHTSPYFLRVRSSAVCRKSKSAMSSDSQNTLPNGNAAKCETKRASQGQEITDESDKSSQRLIWVDLEMTGLDFVKDRILEIACLITEGDLSLVAEGPHLIIHESDEVLDGMDEWCTQHHGESGLIEAVRNSKISIEEAEKMMLDFVREYTPKGKCLLAGNTIGIDRSFILRHMPLLAEHLHHRVIDVSSVKELSRRWYPREFIVAPVKKDKHRAMDDILESIAELRYYRAAIFK